MKKLENFNINKKKVILRADLNIPVVDGKITDYSRLNSIIPSIEKLSSNKNKIFILAHYGRPNGIRNEKLSIEFLTQEIKKKLNISRVHFLDSFEKIKIKNKQSEMEDGEICLFENIRFNSEEERNDLNFSKKISENFDIFVNDAFSASHRYHSSIVGIPNFLPSFAGLSFTKEVENLDLFLQSSKKPNIAIIGGSKISTKINVISNLINLFDSVVIGGAMANTFLKSNSINIGNSLIEEDFVKVANTIQDEARQNKCKIILPLDAVCSKSLVDKDHIRSCKIENVFNDEMILDIGQNTTELICSKILNARSVLWNGPLGAFETKPFDKSSIQIASLIKKNAKKLNIETLAGGGDTLSAINIANAKDGFSYLSNAGGAFLEWLEGNKSPGFNSLEKNNF